MKDVKTLSDEELVVLVCNRDQELYAELITRYQNKLLRYVEYLVRNTAAAEDVVQSAFIKAFINLRSFNTKRKFSSWIYRIAHNQALNQLKKRRREVGLTEPLLRKLVSKQPQPEEDFAADEIKHLLKGCLDELPLRYREPLALAYLEEKSYQEISDTLRIPTGTVGTRINRAKKLLRAVCSRNGIGKTNDQKN